MVHCVLGKRSRHWLSNHKEDLGPWGDLLDDIGYVGKDHISWRLFETDGSIRISTVQIPASRILFPESVCYWLGEGPIL